MIVLTSLCQTACFALHGGSSGWFSSGQRHVQCMPGVVVCCVCLEQDSGNTATFMPAPRCGLPGTSAAGRTWGWRTEWRSTTPH